MTAPKKRKQAGMQRDPASGGHFKKTAGKAVDISGYAITEKVHVFERFCRHAFARETITMQFFGLDMARSLWLIWKHDLHQEPPGWFVFGNSSPFGPCFM